MGLLAPGFIAMPLYSQQAPYFRQIRPDFTLWQGKKDILRLGPYAEDFVNPIIVLPKRLNF